MFGFAARYRNERFASDPGFVVKRRKELLQQLEKEGDTMDEETFERTARLCSIRKRSVEIPLENLLSGMIFLSGGRDQRDGPLLSIVQPEDADIDLLMEVRQNDIIDMLAYFTFVPSEEIRRRKFSVVIAADLMYDFFLKNIFVALNTFQQENDLFHMVYIISSTRQIETDHIMEWAYSNSVIPNGFISTPTHNSTVNGQYINGLNGEKEESVRELPELVLPYCIKANQSELHKVIPVSQLTQEFGGSYKYDHQDWVRFRMQVEPFICDVVGVSKRLAQAIAPFTNEELPTTLKEAEESVKVHRLQRQKTLETLHVDELASEGERIRQRMNSPSKELLQDNPDFSATLNTIDVLVGKVENVRSRLDTLWHSRNDKLEANLKQKKFEQEADQIMEWFEQYAEEFFETHTEIGESLEVAQALITELIEFEESTKQILSKTDRLLRNASELQNLSHLGCDVKDVANKIKGQIGEFETKMESRKKLLNDAVKLHLIMEKSLTWCIEGVEFLGHYDILNMDQTDIDPHQIKDQLQQFHDEFPPPNKDEIKLLTNAVSTMGNNFGKEGFEFALNRILELHDRFTLYNKLLDEMIGTPSEASPLTNHENVFKNSTSSTPSPPPPLSPSTTTEHHTRTNRRMTQEGKKIQVSVLDVDKRAQQALSLLDKTDNKLKKEEEETNVSSDSDCVSLLEFLSEVDRTETPPILDLLDVSETRSRSYSAPDDMTDAGDTLKRTKSLTRRSRHKVISPLPPSPKPDISCPSNPQFEEEPEHVSLDDITVEENPEDIKMQTAHAKHRRKLMEELLTTEEQYIKDLEHIIEKYVPFCDSNTPEVAGTLPAGLVGKSDVLFGLLPTFLEFSRDTVLPRIKKCVRAPIKMGLVFLDHEEEFLNYAMYFKIKPQQDELIANEDQFFKELQEKVGDFLLINAYLIKPVQRMTKYRQFLEEMIKFSTKGKESQEVQKGAKKEYFGKLKEALKMVDFVLRHGNDLLALESLRGFSGNLDGLGRILRVGDLIWVDGFTKHKRKLFLFEKALLFAKTRKTTRGGPTGSEVYDFKQMFKTSELMLREQVPGHETRFALEMTLKKDTIYLQAETVTEKQNWVQEIWDLFFAHMLSLRDDNLQSHGTKALTNVMITGSATLTRGRPLSHSMRKRVHTIAANRQSLEIPKSESKDSLSSVGSATSLKELADYIRNKRDSRNFPSPYSTTPAAGPISPRSSMGAVSFYHHDRKRESTLSTFSTISSTTLGSIDTYSSTPRDSIISHSYSNTTISSNEQENNSPSISKSSSNISELQQQDSTISDNSVNESLKIYNTPL